MKEIIDYVNKAFENIPDSQSKSDMVQEIVQRLEDSAVIWTQKGKEREDAINKAIVEFGDLGEILSELRGDVKKREYSSTGSLWFSIIGSLAFCALMVFINVYYSPRHIWYIYPVFAIIWWPLSIFFFGSWRKRK